MKVALYLAFALLFTRFSPSQSNVPANGYVPDSSTAVKIAEAVLIPVYGEKQIISERPFIARLDENVWTISGTLHCSGGAPQCLGGVATVKISAIDARILYMLHGK